MRILEARYDNMFAGARASSAGEKVTINSMRAGNIALELHRR
jgi:hypothetical protein